MDQFIPDDPGEDRIIPFFEEASKSRGVIGYSTGKDLQELEGEIRDAMAKLGATVTGIQSGQIPYARAHKNRRFAFRIFFNHRGATGRMDVAALPIKKETDARIRQAKRHALYSVVNRLEGLFNSQLVMPGDAPLIPHLLDDEGRTLAQYIADENVIPQLQAPTGSDDDDTVEGEFTEADG